jgi:hypothetical protein
VRGARVVVAAVLAAGALALGTGTAQGQSVSPAVQQLRNGNVAAEPGALSAAEASQLRQAVDARQPSNGFYKVVILAAPVTDYATPRGYAEAVLEALGAAGRIMVTDTRDVGIASNIDPQRAIPGAEQDAYVALQRSGSYAAGASAASASLSGSQGGGNGTPSTASSGGGSGVAVLLVLLLIGAVVVGALLWFRRSQSKASAHATQQQATQGEIKVRQLVDHTGNLVLDLSDRVDRPDCPPRAKELYQQASAGFSEYQHELEQADTVAELEAVYPKVVRAAWQLDAAKAVLDGQPEPPQPTVEPLFPPPPQRAPGAVEEPAMAVPQRSYQSLDASPWLTTAAVAALGLLAGRAGSEPPRHRPPASDDQVFDYGRGGSWRGGGRGDGVSASSWRGGGR